MLASIDGCTPVYIPNAPHAPLFTDRGQVHGTVLLDVMASGFEGHLSWSPIKHMSLVGSALWVPLQDSARGHSYLEGAVGSYLPLYSRRSRQPNGLLGLSSPRNAYAVYVAEMYLGAGRGDARGMMHDIFGPGELAGDVTFSRLFVQGNIGVTTTLDRVPPPGTRASLESDSVDRGTEYYDLGVAVKGSRVDFTSFTRQTFRIDTLIQPWFMQGAIFARYGRERIRGELQIGISRTNIAELPFDWLGFFVAIGVQVKL
jgi:hypothetical protein